MSAIFQDLQEDGNPLNGKSVTEGEIERLFEALAYRDPFMFELRRPNGAVLTVGLAETCGSVQYTQEPGLPPYWLAVNEAPHEDAYVDFLVGSTPTPVPSRYCLPLHEVRMIVHEFLASGSRAETIEWEQV